MKVKLSLVLAAFMAMPFAAMAQSSPPPDPLDANAPVAPTSYVSALKTYRSAADSQTSPDKSWRAANAEVGRLGGHAGHLNGNGEAAPMQMDHSRHQHH